MKIVTGGNGFIGKNIVADLHLGRKECDLRDIRAVNETLAKHNIKTIIHTAARIDSSLTMRKNHTDYFLNNIRSDINMLEAAYLNGINNVLMTSSVSALKNSTGKMSELDLYYSEVDLANFGYNISKKFALNACKVFQLDYGLNYKAVLLGNMYGPHDNFSENGLIVGRLISAIDSAIVAKGDINLPGNGYDERNFTFVKDLNPMFDNLILDNNCDPVIASCSEYFSIFEVAEILKNLMNFIGKIIFRKNNKDIFSRKIVDNSLIMSRNYGFNWTTLKIGLEKTLNWFYDNKKIGSIN